jgi:hypothetical protein
MQKIVIAMLMITGLMSLAHAERNVSGSGENATAACANAKHAAYDLTKPASSSRIDFGECHCTRASYSGGLWACNIDYQIEKMRHHQPEQPELLEQLEYQPGLIVAPQQQPFLLPGYH